MNHGAAHALRLGVGPSPVQLYPRAPSHLPCASTPGPPHQHRQSRATLLPSVPFSLLPFPRPQELTFLLP